MKLKIETSYQVFLDGQPDPVRIVDFSIDTKWSEQDIKNTIALACYPAVKQLQNDVLKRKENEKCKSTTKLTISS